MTTPTAAANASARLPGIDDRPPAASRQLGDLRSRPAGYRVPHDVADRLKSALSTYKNREAAMALALFLARFWSSRAKMARPFPVDRRALAHREDLALSEARIRGALRVLEEIGFLHRGIPPAGSVHKLTPAGELHRKPITFGFGADYGPLFAAANARAARARARREGKAVHGVAMTGARRPLRSVEFISPKTKSPTGDQVIMGELAKCSPRKPVVGPSASPSPVEAALSRLMVAVRKG